jgi:hypothetical protein
MLVISTTLHALVAVGIVLPRLPWRQMQPSSFSGEPNALSLVLLRSGEASQARPLASVTPPASPILPKAPALPVLPKVPIKSAPPAAAAATFALEANPNAHVRALPPETVLSPNPAPHLNSADGVVFLLDVSGSMYEAYEGSTRLAYARQEMSQRIRALPDGTPFAITIYALTARASGPLVAVERTCPPDSPWPRNSTRANSSSSPTAI